MIKLLGISFLAIILCVLPACEGNGQKKTQPGPSVELDNPIKNVEKAATTIGEAGKSVGESAANIDKHADSIHDNTLPAELPKIEPDLGGIKEETAKLRAEQAKLIALESTLSDTKTDLQEQKKIAADAEKKANDLRDNIDSLNDEIKKLKDENGALLKKLMAWLGVICVIGIGASAVFAFLTRNVWAIFVAAGFIITLGISVVVTLYLTWIAYITMGAVAVLGIFIFFWIWKHGKDDDNALKDLVRTTEITKSYLQPDAREHVFGKGAEGGIIRSYQVPNTRKIVRKIRADAKNPKKSTFNLAEPTITLVPPKK